MENLKKEFKQYFNQYKWVILAGVVLSISIMLITANLKFFTLLGYTMKGNTEGVLQITENHILQKQDQNQLTFKKGMHYLLKQETYSKEMQTFFEEYYNAFSPEWQKEIMVAYSKKRFILPMNRAVIDRILQSLDDNAIQNYIEQLSVEDLEHGLALVYGHNPEVTPEFVDTLYNLLQKYPNQLNFYKFQFNLYDVLQYDGENATNKIKLIISKIEPKVAQENLFKHLRKADLSVDTLNEWVEFFNTSGIISASDYMNFNQYYGNICLLRNQQKELDDEETELTEKITVIDNKISEQNKSIIAKEKEIEPIQQEMNLLEEKIDTLTNYSTLPLYIERASGTGSNEYIASVPRNGLFGKRPTDIKYIVKLTETPFFVDGVYELNVYSEGTKPSIDGGECSYFIEVTREKLENIELKKAQRLTLMRQIEAIQAEIKAIEQEIETIKTQNQYQAIKEDIENMDKRREEYTQKIEEEVVQIRKLFGLSHVTN